MPAIWTSLHRGIEFGQIVETPVAQSVEQPSLDEPNRGTARKARLVTPVGMALDALVP
jgi:hypothetical protein